MDKLLIITPHLSTGGQPQYVLKKIELLKDTFDIYCIEYNYLSSHYIVQRNLIKNIIGNNFYSIGESGLDLCDIINTINPNTIWIEEISETFIKYRECEFIYNKQRTWKILETTHTSDDLSNKKSFLPDKFLFVSDWSEKQYRKFGVDISTLQYPIDDKYKNTDFYKKKLNFNKNYKHVLCVGLFTVGKNQKYAIDIAEKLKDENIIFHFVGNTAPNFSEYWKPLIDNLPNNCVIHGERKNVDEYIQACDLFLFPSKFELNPLVVKEALCYKKLPVLMFNLKTYCGQYNNIDGIYFLNNRVNIDSFLIKKILKCELDKKSDNKIPKIQIIHISTLPKQKRAKDSIENIKQLSNYNMDIIYIENELYNGDLDLDNYRDPNNKNVNRGHYGCYLAHKQAIHNISENYDYTIIMEEDAYIFEDLKTFVDVVQAAIFECIKNSVYFISFGSFPLHSEIKPYNSLFDECWHQSLAHCYMIPNKYKNWYIDKFKNNPWDSTDIWFNHIFCHDRKTRLVSKKMYSKQLDGFSLIDRVEKRY
jgi:glycosyltransferase involved in cell wall biosynthesis/GR25 family glycosyltransferase involved in LPS biosynthesis